MSCGDIWGWFPWDLGEAGIMFSCKNRISYSRTLKNIVIIINHTTGKIQTRVWDHPSFIMFTKNDTVLLRCLRGIWQCYICLLFKNFKKLHLRNKGKKQPNEQWKQASPWILDKQLHHSNMDANRDYWGQSGSQDANREDWGQSGSQHPLQASRTKPLILWLQRLHFTSCCW